uniref:LRAT domain-containing protein n=1 Tax=Panagrellus redivivus TaxID=6233 RepID=A0A7E4ZTM5_PANRE
MVRRQKRCHETLVHRPFEKYSKKKNDGRLDGTDLRTRKHLYTTPPSCVDKPDDYLIRGDHIRRNLKVATFNLTYHDGIYLGNGKVAHFTPKNGRGFFSSKRGSGAEIVSIEKFAKGERIFVTSYTSRPRSFNDVALEAEKLVEMRQWETRYNVLERNCQVFVRLCLNYVPSKKEFPSLFLDIVFVVKKLEEDG